MADWAAIFARVRDETDLRWLRGNVPFTDGELYYPPGASFACLAWEPADATEPPAGLLAELSLGVPDAVFLAHHGQPEQCRYEHWCGGKCARALTYTGDQGWTRVDGEAESWEAEHLFPRDGMARAQRDLESSSLTAAEKDARTQTIFRLWSRRQLEAGCRFPATPALRLAVRIVEFLNLPRAGQRMAPRVERAGAEENGIRPVHGWAGAVTLWGGYEGRHAEPILLMAFSPDGALLLTADRTLITLWKAVDGKEWRRLSWPEEGTPSCAVFSRNARHVLVGDDQGGMILFSTETGEPRLAMASGDRLSCLAFAPDGRWVAAGGQRVTMWDLKSGEEWGRLPIPGADTRESTGSIKGIALAPDGRFMAVARSDHGPRLEVWHVAERTLVWAQEARPHLNAPLQFTPDGRWLITTMDRNAGAQMWDATSGQEMHTLKGINAFAVTREGGLVTAHLTLPPRPSEPAPVFYDFTTGQAHSVVSALKIVHATGPRLDGVLSPGGLHARASVSVVHVSSLRDGTERWHSRSDPAILAVGFAPAENRVQWIDAAGTWHRAEIGDATRVRDLPPAAASLGSLSAAAFLPGGARAALSRPDGRVVLWDLAGGRETGVASETGIDRGVAPPFLEPCADGRWVLTRGGACELEYGTRRPLPRRRFPVAAGAIAPDGKRILLCGEGGASLWDLAAERRLPLEQPPFPVHAVAFAPDGNSALLGTYQALVVVDLGTGALGQVLEGHRGYVLRCLFSPDGESALSLGDDSTVRWWDLASGTELEQLNFGAVHDEPCRLACAESGRAFLVGTRAGIVALTQREV